MNKNPILILVHTGLDHKIDQSEVMAALPNDVTGEPKYVEIEVGKSKLSELYHLDYDQLALEQTRTFQREIEPWIKSNPNGIIAYFGLVPVSLAVHLGYLLGNFNNYWVFQHHHQLKKWYLDIDDDKEFDIEILNSPTQKEKGKGDVILRLSSSYLIDENQSLSVVPEPMKEIDVKLKKSGIDALKTQNQLEVVSKSFDDVLGSISSFLPNSNVIHLFAAIPCGLAFLLGTKVNPNVTPKIITYQYSKEEKPPYRQALIVSKQIGEEVALTEEQVAKADEIRRSWAELLKGYIKSFIINVAPESDQWFANLVKKDEAIEPIINSSSFSSLPSIKKLSLKNDNIALNEKIVEGDFDYNKADCTWFFDDRLLVTILNRAEKKGFDLERAGRLFLFHEALHYSELAHNLIQEKAIGIGQFPKVIEVADYQADVYAILNDWNYSSLYCHENFESTKKYFLKAIETAVETMWSFIDSGQSVVQFQIRTMNRLLNWYWQYVMIENSEDSLAEIVEVLINKPIIEIAGLDMKLIGHRTYYILNDNTAANWEMAAFFNNKVYRFAPNNMISIVNGFRELDGQSIIKGIRSFIANI